MYQNTTKQPWVRSGKELLELKITKLPMLVETLIQQYGAISLAGSSDLGKSYFLLQLADAVVKGDKTFLGFQLNTNHKSVIYVTTEDDEFSLSLRLSKMTTTVPDKTVYKNLRVIFDSENLISRLNVLLNQRKADLVIIDTFADVYDGDMNQTNKVRGFLQPFKTLAKNHQTLVFFNHHCGKKNEQKSPHKDNLLGSQGFESSMRTVFELRKDIIDTTKRHLCIVKGNNLSQESKGSSYELSFCFDNGFSNTGQRVPFEKLVKQTDAVDSEKQVLINRIVALRQMGYSIQKITQNLHGEGFKIGKSTVGILSKAHCPSIQDSKEERMAGDKESDKQSENLEDAA